jgi:uncharacterized protein (TIGR03000 family)
VYFGSYGFFPVEPWPWPDIYDVETEYPAMPRPAQFSGTTYHAISANYVMEPAATVAVERRAQLRLSIPQGSKVWLSGREVDANVAPIVLESPPLQEGQMYIFDVKVTWPDGAKTEERTRSVTVGAGQQTSLTYCKYMESAS